MATVLLAVLIALLIGHTVPDLARLRNFDWFENWLRWLVKRIGNTGFWRSGIALAISIGIPVLLLAILQWSLHGHWWGLLSFILAVSVLFYCWGPRDLDLDITAIATAANQEQRLEALQRLREDVSTASLAMQSTEIVNQVFLAALSRWFGVLFWFLVFGPAGALGYRLLQLAAKSPPFRTVLSALQVEAAQSLLLLVNWPVAQLMTLALALAADFDSVVSAWRDTHNAHNSGWFSPEPLYLLAAARASVDLDANAGDDTATEDAALTAMQQSMSLIWRILIVWLALLSLLVLAGKIG